MKCKHDMGWVSIRDPYVFVFETGETVLDGQGKSRKTFKVKMRCNYPDCRAERNAYFFIKTMKMGRIRLRK